MLKQIRKEKEKEFKQSMIIEAAKSLFKEKGFEVTTMEDVALAAGFAKGTVYLYFKSKHELMANIVLSANSDLLDIMEEIAKKDLKAIEKMIQISNLYHNQIKTVIQDYGFGNMWKNIVDMSDFFTQSTCESICKSKRRIFDIVRSIIVDGQTKGEFAKTLDPKYSSIVITSFISGLDHSIFMHKELFEGLEVDIDLLLKLSIEMIYRCLQ